MAIFIAHEAFDWGRSWSLPGTPSGSGSELVYEGSDDRWIFKGSFSYNTTLEAWTGVATSVSGYGGDGPRISVFESSFNVSWLQIASYRPADHGLLSGGAAHLARMLLGDDEVIGSAGSDRLSGFNGNDVVWAQGGNDSVAGGGGDDILHGGAGRDSLSGGSGIDTLLGGDGNDTLIGSMEYRLDDAYPYLVPYEDEFGNTYWEEEPQYYFRGESLDGGAGVDTVRFSGAAEAVDANLARGSAHAVGLDLTDYVDGSHIARASDMETPATPSGAKLDASTRLLGVENLVGSRFADMLTGNGEANVLDGGAGADTLRGGLGGDTYYRDDSGDTIIETASGGIDRVIARVSTTLGANVENLMLSGTGTSSGTGNGLANRIDGNRADNVLSGGSGNDTLQGGGGKDLLVGGGGNDVFLFTALSDLGKGAGRDVIDGWNRGDVIDLRGIDANPAAAGNQAFAFRATSAFTGAGQVRYDRGLLQINTDRDADAEFEIVIAGVPPTSLLAGTDLLL